MDDYVEMIINQFSIKISNSDADLTPTGNHIFEKVNIKRLGKKETKEFHDSVSSGMFVVKREKLILIKQTRCCKLGLKNLMRLVVNTCLE